MNWYKYINHHNHHLVENDGKAKIPSLPKSSSTRVVMEEATIKQNTLSHHHATEGQDITLDRIRHSSSTSSIHSDVNNEHITKTSAAEIISPQTSVPTNPPPPDDDDAEKNEKKSIEDSNSKVKYSIFSHRQVMAIVAIASWSASFSGLSSNIYFPSITPISQDLHVSPELVNLTVTLYLIFQGLSPSIWAPLSDTKGRRTVIIITFTVYLGVNIGLALTKSYAQLAVLRAFQSSASASSVAIGAAIVGDVVDREKRAGFMGIFNAAAVMATALGPVIGGAMSESVGWRSIFWLLVAYGGSFLLLAAIGMPETMRKIVGIGNVRPTGFALAPLYNFWIKKDDQIILTEDERLEAKRARHFPLLNIFEPILLLRHPTVALSSVFLSLHYAIWQMNVTISSTLFAREYGLNELQVGLTFLANGGGTMAGTLIVGRLLDWIYARANRAHLNSNQESDRPLNSVRARLGSTWIFSIIESASVLIFGWTVDKHVHIAVPIIASFFLAAALIAIQTAVQTYFVDEHPTKSASANANMNLTRCLMAAAGTSAILPMTNGMGIGWAFTLLCFLLLASNLMILYLLHRSNR